MSKHLVQKGKTEKKFKPKFNFINKEESIDEIPIETAAKKYHSGSKSPGYLAIIFSIIVIIAIPFCPLDGWMLKAAYGLAFITSALKLFLDVFDHAQNGEHLTTNTVLLFTALLAFGFGFELESVLIIVFCRITEIVCSKLHVKSREKIKELSGITTEYANVDTAEGMLKVEADYVNVGDTILVKAGEIIPLDGVITEGITTIDTSSVSGQSAPWAVNEGYRVFSGCRNITSPIRVKVTKPYKLSTAQNLVRLAESSTEYPSRQEKFAEKISQYYAAGILTGSIVLYIVISLINGAWLDNISRILVLLTTAVSVSALSAVAFCYVKSIGTAAESGVFVKGSDCIESMAKSETVVFDKTGIITEGRYIITDVFPNNVSEHELITVAATAERFSRHPIAVALSEAAGQIEIDYSSLQIEEIPGRGVSAFVEEKQVYVGNAALLEEHGIKCAIPSRPGAAIHVAVDYKYWGHILVTDRIRRGVFDALEHLRASGVRKMVLLTGDVLSVAKPLASKLNFDMLRAELKPSEKVAAVEFLMSNRGDTTALAFVGDGSSDGQIMSHVDVGIAMGALGSDAAFSDADVLIMDRDIKKLPNAFSLSRLAYRVSLEIIICWLAVNSLIIILGIIGVLPVLAAVIIEFILTCAAFASTMRIK